MYTMTELSQLIVKYFELGDDVEDDLCFRYKSREWQQYITLLGNDTIENKVITTQEGVQRPLTIDDVELSILLEPGAIIEEEVNCNSAFMLRIIPIIAAEIRQQLHWVPPKEEVYIMQGGTERNKQGISTQGSYNAIII